MTEKTNTHGGAKIDHAMWDGALKTLLETFTEDEVRVTTSPDNGEPAQVVKVKRHETDPTPGQKRPRGMPIPGPLPSLVREKDIDKKAKVETHDHALGQFTDSMAVLAHFARVVVVEARRIHAKKIAAKTPIFENDKGYTLSVVMVK